MYVPLYHVTASDVEGASKYKMALLSTRRSADTSRLVNDIHAGHSKERHTIAMHNASWLWQRLHPQNSPQVHHRVGVLTIRWVSTEHKKIIAQHSDQGSRGQLRRQALDLNRRFVSFGIDDLEGHGRLAYDPRKMKTTIHDKTTVIITSADRYLTEEKHENSPMRLYQRARELASDPGLPND